MLFFLFDYFHSWKFSYEVFVLLLKLSKKNYEIRVENAKLNMVFFRSV